MYTSGVSFGSNFYSSGVRKTNVNFGSQGNLVTQLKNALALTHQQAENLVRMADVKNQIPFQAGRLQSGEVYLVTELDYSAPGANFRSYKDSFKVYYGQPDQVQELTVTKAGRYRDGGTVYIDTSEGQSFYFPAPDKYSPAPDKQGKPSVNGTEVAASVKPE